MRFKNIATKKKENVEYSSGDVLIAHNEIRCEREVYMVVTRNNDEYYNLIDLNSGVTYFSDFEFYDDFVRKLERIFIQTEAIDNDEFELVRVED